MLLKINLFFFKKYTICVTVEELVEGYSFYGFPCVMSEESQLVGGFITRKEIKDALSMCTHCAVSSLKTSELSTNFAVLTKLC